VARATHIPSSPFFPPFFCWSGLLCSFEVPNSNFLHTLIDWCSPGKMLPVTQQTFGKEGALRPNSLVLPPFLPFVLAYFHNAFALSLTLLCPPPRERLFTTQQPSCCPSTLHVPPRLSLSPSLALSFGPSLNSQFGRSRFPCCPFPLLLRSSTPILFV